LKQRVIKALFAFFGGLVGLSFMTVLGQSDVYRQAMSGQGRPIWLYTVLLISGIFIFAFISYIISPRIYKRMQKSVKLMEQNMNQLQMADIVFGGIGLVAGLVISYFISALFRDYLPAPLAMALSILLYVTLGLLGARLFQRRWHELPFLMDMKRPERSISERIAASQHEKQLRAEDLPMPKLLDSSVLIDGRIIDIYKTGFLEGRLIVPQFILEELQKVADSSDSMKRKRGRRGLDVVGELQRIEGIDISVGEYENDSDDEVDMKLLKLTKKLNGKIMTNDYNLNRVSELSGVHVLNINELSNALKPALISGEEMSVLVVKEGKEQNQGVGYLDDGTMIVIENGKGMIGEKIVVVVTSILQTAAGRMIFAKPRETG
jgi:uncharacterized protein YacL